MRVSGDQSKEGSPIKLRVLVLAFFVASIALMSTVDLVFSLGWRRFGVFPRDFGHLEGVIMAPWLHGSFSHLFANIGALVVLGWFCLWPRISGFLLVTLAAIFGAGLAAWLLGGRQTVHIGASGVVFGYFGFLVLRGWYERTFSAIAVSFGVLFFYGGMVFGVLPGEAGISWQSHFGGFVAGIVMARLLRTTSAENRLAEE
ncbi:MAG: rhomboid family intrarane serine protease [Proteobacteria bacterium]|nr:rhomboid family intrarane serine protease [Pseudomonadota bacterium]